MDRILPLSAQEQHVLDLYDKLQELQLEIALLKAQKTYQAAAEPTESDTSKAQDELLDSRALYVLRKDVVESVMTANPILQAVHNGTKASPIERDLLPYVKQRDDTSISLAKQSLDVRSALDDLSTAEMETLRVSRQNVELTTQLLQLANEVQAKKTVHVDDPELRAKISKLESQLKTSRQKWKVMKGTASAVVAGSGIDWVRDAELREIVLDPEDEG